MHRSSQSAPDTSRLLSGISALLTLCALALCVGCSKPTPPPKVEESCPSLTKQYLQCAQGAAPDDAALKALEATMLAKCEQITAAEAAAAKAPDAPPDAPRLVACANAPCDKINDCLKAATPLPPQPDVAPPTQDPAKP
jgi:hypothetical protein